MIAAPIPENETERLADLRALKLLDTPPEKRFDRIVSIASRVFETPIAYIALVDAKRQWFKAKCGVTVDETGREISFCGHTILQEHDQPLIIPDARHDQRFHDNPLVIGDPFIRFYAGWPLAGPGGQNVGTLCLAAPEPRRFVDDEKLTVFRELAEIAERELGMLDLIQVQRKLIDTKNQLVAAQARLRDELNEAAEYVQALLPPRLEGEVETDWRFIASSALGGDFFSYHWLDERRLVIYLLDVCGHGVGASLLSISVHNALRRETLAGTRLDDPAGVLTALNAAYPMDQNADKYFTLWYGVYDRATRELRYANAGHPPAALFAPGASGEQPLGESGFPIGTWPEATYKNQTALVSPGASLFVFSDGMFEVTRPDGPMLDREDLVPMLGEARGRNNRHLDRVIERLRAAHGSPEFDDDCSVVEFRFA